MTDENKTERLHMLISPSELKAIDDWGFRNRIRTKAEAVRRLCQIGLAYDEQAADWDRLIKDIFDHIGASARDVLEVADEDKLDYKKLHLRSMAQLVFISKSASELAGRMSELARFAKLLQTEDDIDSLIRQQAELQTAIKAAAKSASEDTLP